MDRYKQWMSYQFDNEAYEDIKDHFLSYVEEYNMVKSAQATESGSIPKSDKNIYYHISRGSKVKIKIFSNTNLDHIYNKLVKSFINRFDKIGYRCGYSKEDVRLDGLKFIYITISKK